MGFRGLLLVAVVGCGGAPFTVAEDLGTGDAGPEAARPDPPETSTPDVSTAVPEASEPEAGIADAVEECVPPPAAATLEYLCSPEIQQSVPGFGCGYIHIECTRGFAVAGKGMPGYTAHCTCESGFCTAMGPDWGTCEP